MIRQRSITIQYDLNYINAGVDQLEEYLQSPEIFQTIGISAAIGQTPYPQLSLGNLLLAQKRLQAAIQDHAENLDWHRLSHELEASHSRWQVAWEKKADAEFRQQLDLWSQFLEEYDKDPQANYDRYGYEVRRRAILQILTDEVDNPKETTQEMLSNLDEYLRAVLVPGEFIWDSWYSSSFPSTSYWFLYGIIKSRTLRGDNTGML
jgi:hypothetical protein